MGTSTMVERALLLVVTWLAAGCSLVVEGTLDGRREDGGQQGETCMFDAQCISFDPFNCNRICGAEGRCVDGPAPDGTRCGMGAMQHCVAQSCVMRSCGDGFVDRNAAPAEYCDDGNANPDDGCNNLCTRSCAPPAPANCADDEPCNGEETCADVMGVMVCRAGAALVDGRDCTTPAGAGTCNATVCVPD